MAVTFNGAALDVFRNMGLGDNENTIVQKNGDGGFRSGGVWSSGNIFRFIRSGATKDANNAMRAELLRSLGNAFHLQGMGTDGRGRFTFTNEFMSSLKAMLGEDVLKDDDFGLGRDGVVGSGRPLTQRRISAILQRADELIQANHDEQFDENGWTRVDNDIGRGNMRSEGVEDEEIPAETLMNKLGDDFLEPEIGPVETEGLSEEDKRLVEDTNAPLVAREQHEARLKELQDKLAATTLTAREHLLRLCDDVVKEAIEGVKAGRIPAEKDELDDSRSEGAERDVGQEISGIARDMLEKTLEHHGGDLGASVADELLIYSDDAFTTLNDLGELVRPEPRTEIQELENKIRFYEKLRGNTVEDVRGQLLRGVCSLGDAFVEAEKMSHERFVDDEAFAKILSDHDTPVAGDVRVTPMRMLHNIQVRQSVDRVFKGVDDAIATFVKQNPLVETDLPGGLDSLREKIAARREEVATLTAGSLDGRRYDREDVGARLGRLNEFVKAELATAKDESLARTRLREEVLMKSGVLEYQQAQLAKVADRLELEDLNLLSDLLTHPDAEMKELIEKAMAEHRNRQNAGAGALLQAFRPRFDALRDTILQKRLAEGEALKPQLRQERLGAVARRSLTEGDDLAFASLGNMEFPREAAAGGQGSKAAVLFSKLRDGAETIAWNAVKDVKLTPREIADGAKLKDVDTTFRRTFFNALFRAEQMRAAIDDLTENEGFKTALKALGKKIFHRLFGPSKDEALRLAGALEGLREEFYLGALSDEEGIDVERGVKNFEALQDRILHRIEESFKE